MKWHHVYVTINRWPLDLYVAYGKMRLYIRLCRCILMKCTTPLVYSLFMIEFYFIYIRKNNLLEKGLKQYEQIKINNSRTNSFFYSAIPLYVTPMYITSCMFWI